MAVSDTRLHRLLAAQALDDPLLGSAPFADVLDRRYSATDLVECSKIAVIKSANRPVTSSGSVPLAVFLDMISEIWISLPTTAGARD